VVEKQGAKEGPHQHLTSEVHAPCALSYIYTHTEREEEIDRWYIYIEREREKNSFPYHRWPERPRYLPRKHPYSPCSHHYYSITRKLCELPIDESSLHRNRVLHLNDERMVHSRMISEMHCDYHTMLHQSIVHPQVDRWRRWTVELSSQLVHSSTLLWLISDNWYGCMR
jgi:hypothetical protein